VLVLELLPEIEQGLRRRAAFQELPVDQVAEMILSQVLLDES
jgi:hypothetical protein